MMLSELINKQIKILNGNYAGLICTILTVDAKETHRAKIRFALTGLVLELPTSDLYQWEYKEV
jgi:hypothetical protein